MRPANRHPIAALWIRVAAALAAAAALTALEAPRLRAAPPPFVAPDDVRPGGIIHEADGALPFVAPYPRDGLAFMSPTGGSSALLSEIKWWDPSTDLRDPPPPEYDWAGRGTATRIGGLMIGEASLARQLASGYTLALWFRAPDGAGPVVGWNPLAAVGPAPRLWPDPAQNPDFAAWRVAVVLDSGVPTALLGDTVIAPGGALGATGGAARVDDGHWHHLAVTFQNLCTDEPCTVDGERTFGLARLFVDGQVVAEQRTLGPVGMEQLLLGHLRVDSGHTAQSNFRGADDRIGVPLLGTVGLLDDFFVYNRALSTGELQRLIARAEQRLALVWPPVQPGDDDSTTSFGPVTWPGGFETGLQTTFMGGGRDIVREMPGFPIQDGAAMELSGNDGFSMAAWFNGSRGLVSFDLRYGDGPGEQFYLETMNGVVRFGCSTGLLNTEVTDAVLPPFERLGTPIAGQDRWRLLTISVDGFGIHQVWVDGLPVGTWSESNGLLDLEDRSELWCRGFTGTSDNFKVRIGGGGAVVAWAALYATEHSQTTLTSLARPGPQVWITAGVGERPTERVNGLPVAVNGSPIWPTHGRMKGTDGVAVATSGTPASLSIPGVGALDIAELGRAGAFTAMARFSLTKDDVGPTSRQPVRLFERENLGGFEIEGQFVQRPIYDTRLLLHCDGSGCVDIDLDVVHPTTRDIVRYHFAIDPPMAYGEEHVLSVSWPGRETGADGTGSTLTPLLAIDGALLEPDPHQSSQGAPIHDPSDRSRSPTLDGNSRWHFGPGRNSTSKVLMTLNEARLYGHATRRVDEIGATCATLDCAGVGRTCHERSPDGLAGAVCGACDDAHFALGIADDGTPSECVRKIPLFGSCGADGQCDNSAGNALCRGQRCLPTDEAVATAWCAANQGRSVLPWADVFYCNLCLLFHEDERHSREACDWKPDRDFGEACSSDPNMTVKHFSCRSGFCDCAETSRYDPGHQTPAATRCTCGASASDQGVGPQTADDCWKLGRQAVPVQAYQGVGTAADRGWVDGAAYRCSGDAMTCREHYDHAWTVLASDACSRGRNVHLAGGAGASEWTGYTNNDKQDSAKGLELLKRFFLSGANTSSDGGDYKRLLAAGVGPELFLYMTGDANTKAALRQRYGDFLPLSLCENGRNSAYFNKDNTLTCTPSLQRDGSQCPPVGEPADHPHQWCQSAYCGRASHVCERGGALHESDTGSTDKGEHEGKARVAIHRTDNQNFRIESREGSIDTWKYRTDYRMKYDLELYTGIPGCNPCQLSMLSLDFTVDKLRGPECAKSDVGIRVLGVPLPRNSEIKPLASCRLVDVADGCDQSLNCELSADGFADGLFAPSFNASFCLPMPESFTDKTSKKFSLLEETGIPLAAEIGLTFDLCLGLSAGMAGGLPQIGLRPSAGISAYAKGGIGEANDVFDAWFGVRMTLLIYELAFPITLKMALDTMLVDSKTNNVVDALMEISLHFVMAIEQSWLSGAMSLFAEFTIGGIFTIERHWDIFAWTGIKLSDTLLDLTAWKKTLDFKFHEGQ